MTNIPLKNIPKINIQKKQDWSLHSDNLIRIFPDTKYSNFTLKWFEIIQRIDNINDLIRNLYIDFHIINMKINSDPIQDAIIKTPLFYKQKFLTEQIFYWIRKTVDEIISIIYVLDYLKKNNEYPKKIKIDCIGKLLSDQKLIPNIRYKHSELLTIINDISNTYKHSFLNSEIHAHIGEIDPLVFSYGFKNNDIEKDLIFTKYKVEDIINSLNILLADFIIYLKDDE